MTKLVEAKLKANEASAEAPFFEQRLCDAQSPESAGGTGHTGVVTPMPISKATIASAGIFSAAGGRDCLCRVIVQTRVICPMAG